MPTDRTPDAVAQLDAKGRCCGRKPLVYKRPMHYLFCFCCNRSFDPSGAQTENWAWRKMPSGGFERKVPL